MSGCHSGYNGQSQTVSPGLSVLGLARCAIKRSEQKLCLFVGYARAGVADLKLNVIGTPLGFDSQDAACRGIAYGVSEQIIDGSHDQ